MDKPSGNVRALIGLVAVGGAAAFLAAQVRGKELNEARLYPEDPRDPKTGLPLDLWRTVQHRDT